ncbi:MAG: hypothetical protein AAGB51_08990 [Planctomycetota bacterium]
MDRPARRISLSPDARTLRHLVAMVTLVAASVAMAMLAGGCESAPQRPVRDYGPTPPPQRAPREVRAMYDGGRLQAALPETLRVPAVLAAARTTLSDRGFTIVEHSSTAGLGKLSAEPPAGSRELLWPRNVTVTAAQTPRGHRLDIDLDPGNSVLAYAILDDMLRRLGR